VLRPEPKRKDEEKKRKEEEEKKGFDWSNDFGGRGQILVKITHRIRTSRTVATTLHTFIPRPAIPPSTVVGGKKEGENS